MNHSNIDATKIWNKVLEQGIVLDPVEFESQLKDLIANDCKGDRIVWGCTEKNMTQTEYTMYISDGLFYLVEVRAFLDLKSCEL